MGEPAYILPKGAFNIKGQKFGDLTAVEPVGNSRLGVLWRCECACGYDQIRSAAALRKAIDKGYIPACPRCVSELRRGRAIFRRNNRRSITSMEWIAEFGLYGRNFDEREIEKILNEASLLIGGVDPAPIDPNHFTMDVPWEGTAPSYRQDWSELYPMEAPEEHAYECVHCLETDVRGWGCVNCTNFVCYGCGAKEAHRCGSLDEYYTLEACGLEFNISRERVRQIELRGLNKSRMFIHREEGRARAFRHQMRAAATARIPNVRLQEAVAEAWTVQHEKERVLRREKRLADRFLP